MLSRKLRMGAKTFHLVIALLLFSTLFVSHSGFVEAQILPKWYAFFTGTVLLFLVCFDSFAHQRITILLNHIDVALSVFLCYLFVRMCLTGVPAITILAIASFTLLYFLFKAISDDEIKYIGTIIVCLCCAQALYGIGQWAGIFPAAAGFKMTGSFDNPAGLAACLAAGFPFFLSLTNKSKIHKIIGYIYAALIAIVIIMSGSRAGILAITIVSIAHLVDKYHQLIKMHLKFAVLISILFILFSIGLIFMKKDSAVGRVAIWRNSLEMIVDKPIFGHGVGVFTSHYMLYQADYFTDNPDSKYAPLANNVTHPFNEYLLLAIEYGIVGLLFLFLVIVIIFRSVHKFSIPILCLLSIAIFACFSYPLRYPFVWVLAAYSLTRLSEQAETEKTTTLRPFFLSSSLLLATAVIIVFMIRDIRFEYDWCKLARRGDFSNKDELLESYDSHHKRWNGNPLFLYNYGATLNQLEQYAMSNIIMKECEIYLNDYDVQILLADNNFKIENWKIAENHYILASSMIPSRFLPLGRLMELYQLTERQDLALEIAKKVTVKEIKVPSSTVYNIIRKAESFLYANSE